MKRIIVPLMIILATTVAGPSYAQNTTWKKRVTRTLDLKVAEDNKTHQLKNIGSDSLLAQCLVSAVMTGKVTAYISWEDHPLTTKMTIQELKDRTRGTRDTIIVVDPITGKEIKKIRVVDFNYDMLQKFRILEDWIFNPTLGTTDIQIAAVGPVLDVFGDDGSYRGTQLLFWLRYKDAQPIIARYEQYHPDNTLAMHIWNDYFLSDVKPKEQK